MVFLGHEIAEVAIELVEEKGGHGSQPPSEWARVVVPGKAVQLRPRIDDCWAYHNKIVAASLILYSDQAAERIVPGMVRRILTAHGFLGADPCLA